MRREKHVQTNRPIEGAGNRLIREKGVSLRKSVHRWMSIMIVLALVFTMVPPLQVSAAGADIQIKGYYTASDANYDRKLASTASTSPIQLNASIRGIDAEAAMENLHYVVTNVDRNIELPNTTARPQVSDNGFDVTFHDVELTEGLNRIQIIFESTNGDIKSEPAWIYYSPNVRIDELMIGNARWDEDEIYPANPNQSTLIEISGKVYNASTVTVQRYGDPEPQTFITVEGDFGIFADARDDMSNAEMFLDPGDNLLTFSASRNTFGTQISRKLIYDNGDPFVYDAVLGTGEMLLRGPTVEAIPNKVKAKAKVDLLQGGILEYPYLDISISNLEYRFNLTTGDITDLSTGNPVVDTNLASVVHNTDRSKTGRYNVYDIEVDPSAWITAPGVFPVDITFSNGVVTDNISQDNLSFTYVDPNRPNVIHIARKIGEGDQEGTQISETGTEIAEQPETFYVYTNQHATEVNVYLNTMASVPIDTLINGQAVAGATNQKKFTYKMEGVPSGNQTLIFVPSDGTTENAFGSKSYTFRISGAPNVVLFNARNGLVLENLTQLRLTTTNPSHGVTGRFVNTPSNANVRAFMNNVDISSFLAWDKTDNTFVLAIDPNGNGANSLGEGSNTLRFDIYMHNSSLPITTAAFEIFMFTDKAPELTNIKIFEPDANNPVFRPGALPRTYFTFEDDVRFTGKYANITELRLTVYGTDQNGDSIEWYDIWRANSSGNFERPNINNDDFRELFSSVDDNAFTTRYIDLSLRGDTTFEFYATNGQIEVVSTFTITRQTKSYEILYPETFVNVQGVEQANVNSNFVEVAVRAEYADNVVYDGQMARKGNNHTFYFEVADLKSGRAKKIDFEVLRGQEKIKGSLMLNYADQPVMYAKYKSELKNTINVFNKMISMKFARTNSLMRLGDGMDNPILTRERQLMFGIANESTGVLDPDIENSNTNGEAQIRSLPRNFQRVSPLYWIDAGLIRGSTDLKEAYTGSGLHPYEGYRNFYSRYRSHEDVVVPRERVEITFKYDDSIIEGAWRYLTVFQYGVYENINGDIVSGWRNIGGVVNTKNKTITVNVDSFGFFQVGYMARSFEDVVVHEWAKDEMETLYSKGIMGPRPGSSLFRPSQAVTRGEFITMLIKIFDIPLNYEGTKTFVDASDNDGSDGLWDYKYIETAARAGIVRGYGRLGRVSPNDTLTREQAAIMIARAGEFKLSTMAKAEATLNKSFDDVNAIARESLDEVEAVVKQGLITGKPVSGNEGQVRYIFDPSGSITRAELATIAIRVLQNQKKIPK